MPTTPVLHLPYPAATDPADVPTDMGELATRIEVVRGAADGLASLDATGKVPAAQLPPVSTVVPIVTALPASPTDGEEVILTDSLTAPTLTWRFRYRAGSSSPYKWEFVGGAPFVAEVLTLETTTSTVYTNLATLGPQFTVPCAGDYVYTVTFQGFHGTANGIVNAALKIGAATASDDDSAIVTSATANAQLVTTKPRKLTGVVAATVLLMQYKASTGTGNFLRRVLTVQPARVA